MKFHSTSLPGVWLIELEPRTDERGYLARTYCETEFAAHGLNTRWVQSTTTLTQGRGTLRGLHYQAAPRGEAKLIRCLSGGILDVLLDVRSDSPTFGRWESFELDDRKLCELYVPVGFAHGFQCLTDSCSLLYNMSEFYVPELSRGIRWNDPDAKIIWSLGEPRLSQRDAVLPLLAELRKAPDGEGNPTL